MFLNCFVCYFGFLCLPFWLSTHIYLLILYFLKTHYASIPCLDQFWWWWRNIKIIIMKRCLKFIAQFTSLMCFCSDIYYYTCLNIYNVIYFMRFCFSFHSSQHHCSKIQLTRIIILQKLLSLHMLKTCFMFSIAFEAICCRDSVDFSKNIYKSKGIQDKMYNIGVFTLYCM